MKMVNKIYVFIDISKDYKININLLDYIYVCRLVTKYLYIFYETSELIVCFSLRILNTTYYSHVWFTFYKYTT